MSGGVVTTGRWESLTTFSESYTCYSAAVATWVAWTQEDWPSIVNPGLWLTVADATDGLFGFVHFPPGLRAALGLVRTGGDESEATAGDGVLAELRRSGRVIVAGDGFNLPWHVAFERRHVPHWYVLIDAPEGPTIADPFVCRNELGSQTMTREPVAPEGLAQQLLALPGEDPVLALRETFALGDDPGPPGPHRYQWFVHAEAGDCREPVGAHGPDAVLRLARHFREHGQDLSSYAQADDIWSIARHRAFLARYAAGLAESSGEQGLVRWLQEHGEPLAKRWGHLAPLMMQATLALGAGRAASASVPDALEELATRERAATDALPAALRRG